MHGADFLFCFPLTDLSPSQDFKWISGFTAVVKVSGKFIQRGFECVFLHIAFGCAHDIPAWLKILKPEEILSLIKVKCLANADQLFFDIKYQTCCLIIVHEYS